MREPTLISVPVTPRTPADGDRLAFGLRRLMAEDPAIRVTVNARTGVTVVHGLSELHLEIIVDRLKREFGVEAILGAIDVALKETVSQEADGAARYVTTAEGRGVFAYVKLHLQPEPEGAGYVFENATTGMMPEPFIKSIDEGVREALARGVLAGYPIDDLRIVLYDGAYHETDSSEHAFKIAGSLAFQDAALKAKPVLLEPIMRLEVSAPEEYRHDIVDDVKRRRGRIESERDRDGRLDLTAAVPLAEMLGYATGLRGFTRGRGSYTMRFERYERAVDPAIGDDDRTAPITSPLRPAGPNRSNAAEVPELFDDDDWSG